MEAIFACSRDGVIGDSHDLPWSIPEDMRHFKEITRGRSVLMGRKTWESLPEKNRPLPGRRNIVVSTRESGSWSDGAEVVSEIPEDFDGVVIGGEQIYRMTMDMVDTVHLTMVDTHLADHLGNTAVYAPLISEDFDVVSDTGWLLSIDGLITARSTGGVPVRYRFIEYRR